MNENCGVPACRGPAVLAALVLGVIALAPNPAHGSDASAGTITVGDRSWSLVPSIQCSMYPGPVVSIAGHAEGNPNIEITIDYDPGSEWTAAKVTGGADDLHLSAQDEDLTVRIDGKAISGSGTFKSQWGTGPSARGSFDVEC